MAYNEHARISSNVQIYRSPVLTRRNRTNLSDTCSNHSAACCLRSRCRGAIAWTTPHPSSAPGTGPALHRPARTANHADHNSVKNKNTDHTEKQKEVLIFWLMKHSLKIVWHWWLTNQQAQVRHTFSQKIWQFWPIRIFSVSEQRAKITKICACSYPNWWEGEVQFLPFPKPWGGVE